MPRLDLLVASGTILFLELALIRWLPAHVLFLSFFTNTVLLASFVGMSVGCLTARKPTREIVRTPVWLLATLGLALAVQASRGALERHTDVGNQFRPEVVFFGAEVSALRPVSFTVPVEVIAGAFFFLTAATMVGPGQELGRALVRVRNRTAAYSLDLLGSLFGIGLFAACSALELPPVVWFAVAAAGLKYLLRAGGSPPTSAVPLSVLVGCVALTALTSGLWPGTAGARTFWSPYYRIDYEPAKRFITTNQISHQVIHARGSPTHTLYDQPHLFRRALGRPAFRRVLIIGAGSGNDLTRALAWTPPDARIDAVEIDPVIQRIGVADNPDRPYQDPRVTVHLTDGRNFLRRAPAGEYDLVIFALVDSLVLHSGYSNIRLESYLFTQESFRDVARVLKPDGQAVVYNFFRQEWIVARVRDELRAAFGTDPIVLTVNAIDPEVFGGGEVPMVATGGFTAIFAGRPEGIDPLKAAFAANGAYWVPGKTGVTERVTGGFGPAPPADQTPAPVPLSPTDIPAAELLPPDRPDWLPLRPTRVESPADLAPATDDWPFLYVRNPTVPALTLRGIGLTVLLSGLLWWAFRERAAKSSSLEHANGERGTDTDDRGLLLRAFFLGAGFMLIETRAVVQMALLFGSTWEVNTVVFASILGMALAGNLFAGWAKPRRLEPFYLGLFLALAANLLVPADSFLGLDYWPRTLAACGLAFAPVLFAGVVFPVSFARAPRADRFFGANVAGALAGGLAENLSMLVGFRLLAVVAVGLYGLSALWGGRGNATSGPDRGV